jgi:adenylate cyclase
LVEDIIGALSRVKQFFVIARHSSFTYKGRAIDVKQVGRELGVQYVLEGSVRRAGGRLRITGQLMDAAHGTHIWGEKYDGLLGDVFDLQDRVSANVVGAIEPKLRQQEMERARRQPTENVAAYDLYLNALWHHWQVTREGSEETLRLCQAACKIDQAYASPMALAAWCYVWRRSQGWARDVEEEGKEGIRLARSAIAADRDDPTVLTFAAHALAYLAHEYDGAMAYVDRAITLNPNSAIGFAVKGWIDFYIANPRSAIEAFQRAIRLSPLDQNAVPTSAGIAMSYVALGDWEKAEEWGRRALQESPNLTTAYRALVVALVRTGRTAGAQQVARKWLQISPDTSISLLRAISPHRDTETLDLLLEAYRAAGLPE